MEQWIDEKSLKKFNDFMNLRESLLFGFITKEQYKRKLLPRDNKGRYISTKLFTNKI